MNSHPATFVRLNTSEASPPHVPEIRLLLADEVHDLWLKTEDELQQIGLPPPFWAFAWAGGQGLARYVLDHPALVSGKRVVDFATGSGLVAIAARMAGAASALAVDIAPWCGEAVDLNSRLNKVSLDFTSHDMIGEMLDVDVLLAGDVFYDKAFADRLIPWFSALSSKGIKVIIGDPGRAYCPRERLEALAVYQVPVTRMLEDAEVKKTTVWRFR